MPPSDESIDDLTIPEHAVLWRRVRADQTTTDENLDDRRRPSSQAFQDIEQGGVTAMSVFIADVEIESGTTPTDILTGYEGWGLAAVTVAVVRSCGLRIVRAPEPDRPGHAHVIGKKTGSIRSKLAKSAEWIVEPRYSE